MVKHRARTSGTTTHRRERRHRLIRRRYLRRRLVAGAVVVLVVAAGSAAMLERPGAPIRASTPTTTNSTPPSSTPRKTASLASPPRQPPPRLVQVRSDHLPAALQDTAAGVADDRIVAGGGLTAADTSTRDVITVVHGSARLSGRLPLAQHDAGAVGLGSFVYVFGGGDGVHQLDHILRIDPHSGVVTTAGHLPQPSSDSVAAAVGSTGYVIGGYTGARWLDTIVAFQPGHAARVVAHLPTPLRYAAACGVGRLIVIAGGSLPNGSASRAIYAFDPARARVKKLGELKAPTTHASASSLGGTAYVIGGRGAIPGTAVASITAIDPIRELVVPAGTLREPLSDLAAVTRGTQIVLIGGRTKRGTTSAILNLRAVAATVATPAAPATQTGVNVYAATGANMLNAITRRARPLVYVPNSQSNTVDVIDQHTFKIIRHFAVGRLPQHVTPSWDLRTLYVDNDRGNSLTPIDPVTGRVRGPPIPVDDPYNLYFTVDGRFAIVVAEALHRLDFRDPHSLKLRHSLTVPCRGVDHIDFTANGRFLLASCEFSSQMLVVDVPRRHVARVLTLPRAGGMPQDVKLSPDGTTFFVADMTHNGLWLIDAHSFRFRGFLATGKGAHGLYPSRDAKLLYVTNRDAGTISVVSFATRKIVATWPIPNGTPDMGGVSADGRTLWLSGRYRAEVYAIDTSNGKLRARIPVGAGPHGLSVWPQPGRFSLGHTGLLR